VKVGGDLSMADVAGELEEAGFKRTLKDLFAGAVGGIAQVLLGKLDLFRDAVLLRLYLIFISGVVILRIPTRDNI
jgi:hypothetical protein